jgi:uncharacterized protein YecT (DUF1311 family)
MILALTLALAAQDVEINCDKPSSQLENTECAAQDVEINCDKPSSQLENTECAAREFRDADAELNRRWTEWIAHARAADGAYRGSDTGPGYEQILRDAQRSWVAFRDAHCAYDARIQARGGTLEPLIYEDCRKNMTRDRIRQLDAGDQTLSER